MLGSGMLVGQQSIVTVSSVQVSGNRVWSEREIASWLQLQKGTLYHDSLLAADMTTVLARYHQEGYFHAAVDSVDILYGEDRRTVSVTIALKEGKPAIVCSLLVEGAGEQVSAVIGQSLRTRPGEPFRQKDLESDIQVLLKWLEERGFPFASVTIDDVSMHEGDEVDSVTVTLRVREGNPVRLRELRVEGNTTTTSATILREARFDAGGMFREEVPSLIQRRLQRTQLFTNVTLPELYVKEDGSAGLLVKVTEGQYNQFDGILGYVPSSGPAEQGTVTGMVQVQFRNILGTGRKFSARWSREERGTQDIQLRYVEPWVASLPLTLDGTFGQRKQDSTYIRRQYGLATELMVSEELFVGASFSQTGVVPSEQSAGALIAGSTTNSVGVMARYDTWDDPVTPTGGIRYRAEYHTGSKRVEGLGTIRPAVSGSTQRIDLDLEYVISPLSKQVVAASLFLRETRSGELDLSDLYRLGGSTTLRGYREGQFLASRLAWINVEYRVLVSPRSFAFTFVDAGYMMTPDRPAVGLVRSEQSKVGYGLGIRLDTALGLMGVSLAMGEGDTFSTMKLHFRLINGF